MDMYIEKELKKSLVSNSPGVCYVCGSPRSATYVLHTKPVNSEPHFPFLEHHDAPAGCEPPKDTGTVFVCYVCYALLIAQWDSHERNNTPYSTRLYWLKRVDQGPYSGNGNQGTNERIVQQATSVIVPPKNTVSPDNVLPVIKRCRADSYVSERSGPSDAKIAKTLQTDAEYSAREENDVALDLRKPNSVSRGRESERIPSRCSVFSQEAASSFSNSETGSEILDLSMPDKNATSEVCYVCGDEFQKGLLTNIYAKPNQQQPFFPSLTLHPRPSRSRPMDSAGRVQACEACLVFLLQQWHSYQARNTPQTDRNYILRKRQTPVYDTSTFVCYTCGLEYPSSSLRILYCRPNVENEVFFPYLESSKTPPGALPISAQGFVQVCAICAKSIPQRHQAFGISESSRPHSQAILPPTASRSPGTRMQRDGTSPDVLPAETSNAGGISVKSPDLLCYVCHRACRTDSMKLLHCYPEVRSSQTAHGMHFPFLKTLAAPPGPSYFDPQNRTLVCYDCFAHFSHQWQVFDRDGLPLELRHYTLPPALSRAPLTDYASGGTARNSPARHEGLLTIAAASSGKNLNTNSGTASPGHSRIVPQQRSGSIAVPSPAPDSRRPSSSQSSKTPPSSSGQATPSLTPVPAKSSSSKNGPSDEGNGELIYCFLCEMHSARSFAHWLPSAPPSGASSCSSTPYFPFLKKHNASPRAEPLREDGAALVCTFCYHMILSQWKQYEDAPANKSLVPETRVYNTHDYICYVCGIATYRKRVRALPVKDFPFLKQHRQPRHSLSIEDGQFVVVCLDCFESLRAQSTEYERWGLPVEKRQYNWMAIPPPPEDSNNLSTPYERLLALEQQKKEKKKGDPSKSAPIVHGLSSSGELAKNISTSSSSSPDCTIVAESAEKSSENIKT